MKTKSIVISSIMWLAFFSTVAIWAFTFAGNNWKGLINLWNRIMSGQLAHKYWSGNMMRWEMMFGFGSEMQNLSETDRQAMMDAITKAMESKNYSAFKLAHEKYGITLNMTEDQFNTMLAKKAEMDQQRTKMEALRTKSDTAIKNGDYETRGTLNKDNPILKIITTKEKFLKLQEMQTYREKMEAVAKGLGMDKMKWGDRWEWRWEWRWRMWGGMWFGMTPLEANNTTTK